MYEMVDYVHVCSTIGSDHTYTNDNEVYSNDKQHHQWKTLYFGCS